ncbi:hypothetical protein ONS96_006849 [Cadophora gregata f. sp. sojae]|nr:hypothetical protein ONS96_006849 [Cadophora gregata f. sp. sojae]
MDLNYLINHIFLPPKLPQADDYHIRNDQHLTELVRETLHAAAAFSPNDSSWASLSTMTDMLSREDSPDMLSSTQLIGALGSMRTGSVLVLHIHAQNAGLIVRREDSAYIFESFELSPTTNSVIGTGGRLLRSFPGPAIAVDTRRVKNITFREAFVQCVGQLESRVLEDACSKSRKAGSDHVEIRQTADPKYVTEMLMGILRAIGKPHDVQRVLKYTRDEVLWRDTLAPWRRSARWLLLRVALQTSLKQKDGDRTIHIRYKMFMVLLLTRVLDLAVKDDFPGETLFIMTAKIGRRMLKLGQLVDQMPWLHAVRNSVTNAQQVLENRWSSIQESPDPTGFNENSGLDKMLRVSDTHLRLRSVRGYLKEIQERQPSQVDPRPAIPACDRRVVQDASSLPSVDILQQSNSSNNLIWLLDIEAWARNQLQDWLAVNILGSPSAQSCRNLSVLLSLYRTTAFAAYPDPENFSIMVLTLMDFWVALDKCVVIHEPLLKLYKPGFPASLFNRLLISKKDDLDRLFRIEQYLDSRRSEANDSYPLLFLEGNTQNSFAVQYFERSLHHQKLKRDIEAIATTERDQKMAELTRLKAQQQSSLDQAQSMVCTNVTVMRGKKNNKVQVTEHNPACAKCKLRTTAQNMVINIHEWPLPFKDAEAKAAVFELDVPEMIWIWRESTYEMLVEVFTPPFQAPPQPEDKYTFFDFKGISRWLKTRKNGRVQLASHCKEVSRSHYKSQKCTMYDKKSFLWTREILGNYCLGRQCIFDLPAGPYKQLQPFLDGCGHTSNEVLAAQDRCPESLTLHEFYSFSTLRSGHRLQWRNIARELASQALNFNHRETHLLMMQAAWEAGPASLCPARDSHIDLEEFDFGMSLISALNEGLSCVESNWQGASAVRTFTTLALRLLSLSPCENIHFLCFEFLDRARNVVMGWMYEVLDLLHSTEEESELKKLALRILDLALTCHATFDADARHLPKTLESALNVSILIECAINIRDRRPANNDDLDESLVSQLGRLNRRAQLLEPALRHRILSDCQGIDDAISRLWSAYSRSGGWSALPSPNERWIVTQIYPWGSLTLMTVHYNILNGTFLVDGSPLSRLPLEYERHETYRRIFGGRVLEVVPSQIPGMFFESRREIQGYSIHFKLHNDDLVIRARACKDGCEYELLPLRAVMGDFPQSLVTDYVHWLDFRYGSIELRPISNLWEASPNHWRTCSHGADNFSLLQNARKLVEIESPTAQTIYRILSQLEESCHIHVMFNFEKSIVEVHLPRMGLDFYIEQGSKLIVSKQYRGMCIDADQSIGSLNGLRSKLVLREVDGSSRIVIIPDGPVNPQKYQDHVRITIDIDRESIHCHQFQIDGQLGRLIDNGSLRSRLFKIYLHAVTSYCLPDTLTGRTGTEEALESLTQASTQSFVTFDKDEVELLDNIAHLSPVRKYYPKHLRTMETIKWRQFPILQQHDRFFEIVKSIKSKAASMQVFQETRDSTLQLDVSTKCPELYMRARNRLSNVRVDGYGAEDFTTKSDLRYLGRDQSDRGPSRELQVYSISKQVDSWSKNNLKHCPGLLSKFESWGTPVSGTTASYSIGFSNTLLSKPEELYPSMWYTFQDALTSCDRDKDKYKVMFFLATLAQSPHADFEILQVLLAFATVKQLSRSSHLAPTCQSINLDLGYTPDRNQLLALFRRHQRPFDLSIERHSPALPGESKKAANTRRANAYNFSLTSKFDSAMQSLLCQLPGSDIAWPTIQSLDRYVAVDDVKPAVIKMFDDWDLNERFKIYVNRLTGIIKDNCIVEAESPELYSFTCPKPLRPTVHRHIAVEDMFGGKMPHTHAPDAYQDLAYLQAMVQQVRTSEDGDVSGLTDMSTRSGPLPDLLSRLASRADGLYEKNYVLDLENSYVAFARQNSMSRLLEDNIDSAEQQHLDETRDVANSLYQAILVELRKPPNKAHQVYHDVQMSPRLSPSIILSFLSHEKVGKIPRAWRTAIVQYGLAVTAFQRAQRLKACLKSKSDLLGELENPGHTGWDPVAQPDWLLLEIENNILIRQEQAEIANEMISPACSTNSLMQLNMGQGKSSVIVPIVAATLADGSRLARVVVLKSLSKQMFHLLQTKLGGLINRQIFYIPISRSLKLTSELADQIRNLYHTCKKIGGVLLVQPEHVLSFELLGLDFRLTTRNNVGMDSIAEESASTGEAMIDTQKWLLKHSRDILDESDEILSVKFELIYTMGTQRATEFSPDRWQIIQRVLGILADTASSIATLCPTGIEFLPARFSNGFPRIRILQQEAGVELLSRVAREFCESGITGLPVWNLPQQARNCLFIFLTCPSITLGDMAPLQNSALNVAAMASGLLLLRGLFAGGILTFVLSQKRWRVNYGLHLCRTRLAVPYQAKDSPSARAEFSHPDTAIVLTCLSYYYGGLDDKQIYESFEELFRSDHPQEQYQEWIKCISNMPVAFKNLSGVNLSNSTQCSQMLFPLLKFSKGLIDFHMSHLVFPKEMKEFTHKLSSSGWEIGRDKSHTTTGFSGTNDSRYILPVPVKQCDMPQQLHTNAAVLECLLRPENTIDSRFTHNVDVVDANVLLHMAVHSDPAVRVILDVGAQVLELTNEEFARKWLFMLPGSEVQAAIYVDDHNEICVVTRTGLKEPLQVSPYSRLIDQCIVYLDEAHTRGTDLKMPSNYRAIVTLGPDLTKDRLTQACMRLRKLGKGQSVVFCASLEIQLKILCCNGKKAGEIIEVSDVLAWCIRNTWQSTKKSVPLWATQGVRHYRRRAACSTASGLPAVPSSILEAEAQSLEQRYAPCENHYSEVRAVLFNNAEQELFSPFKTELDAIREKCQEFGLVSLQDSNLHEEQERELQPENEREQQIERPPALTPRAHFVHQNVINFAATGVLDRFSTAFTPAFSTLLNTSAGAHFEPGAWPQDLLVTADFAQTVTQIQHMDQHLRPVHWLLTLRRAHNGITCVIISPQEANELLPIIRKKQRVTLHVYTPRLSLANHTLEDLAFCAIPALPAGWVIPPIGIQINLFAGQLYLRCIEEYFALCQFLGLCYKAPDDQIRVACDGFVNPEYRKMLDSTMARHCRFMQTPIPFLRALFAMRRKGQGFANSHLGRILNGELLRYEHFVMPGQVMEVVESG